ATPYDELLTATSRVAGGSSTGGLGAEARGMPPPAGALGAAEAHPDEGGGEGEGGKKESGKEGKGDNGLPIRDDVFVAVEVCSVTISDCVQASSVIAASATTATRATTRPWLRSDADPSPITTNSPNPDFEPPREA